MNRNKESLNNKAWENLFNKYSILENIDKDGKYEITAKEINEFREARLMTKFDYKKSLPNFFKEYNLSILPITRGSYVISHFDAYQEFENTGTVPHTEIHKVATPEYIQSIDFEYITSEATALNVAYLSGILKDFTNEEILHPTVNGRMSSEEFSFNIYNQYLNSLQNINVLNSQIEIDAGYEGLDSLILIEAKNSLSDDFLIRQLYYPYRKWHEKITKTVRSVFLTYTNGLFSLYEYKFSEPENYNSIHLTHKKVYTLSQEDIQFEDVMDIFNIAQVKNEPSEIPFPQADSFSRIINICELLDESNFLTPNEIIYKYDFDIRQVNYYMDACRYLGLVDKKINENGEITYCLTEKGKSLFKLSIKNRNLFFVKAILEKRAFNFSFNEYISNLEMPSKSKIIDIMKNSNLYRINSDHTFRRRASTISSWLNWILDLTR